MLGKKATNRLTNEKESLINPMVKHLSGDREKLGERLAIGTNGKNIIF